MCVLFVVCGSLFVVAGWLMLVGYLLCVTCGSLLLFVVCWLLRVGFGRWC